MKILHRLREESTGFRKPGRINSSVDISEESTGNSKFNGFTECNEYILKLSVCTNYFANHAQKPHARKFAERRLLHVLYGDILPIVAEIEAAIFSQDDETALEACRRLKSELGI
jgi:hypothetical protein